MSKKFDELVHERYELASSVNGNLGINEGDFREHIARIVARHSWSNGPEEDSVTAFVSSLHTTDLALALACAKGTNAGWQRLGDLYRKFVGDVCRHLVGLSRDAEELGDALWVDLFLPDRSGQSRIGSYDGRSSLSTWLRVVVSNRVINERVRKGSRFSTLDGLPEPPDPAALHQVEDGLGIDRYGRMILCSFETAAARLTPQERLIVLFRYDQGLQLGEIARLFSVHQSTITRQLDRTLMRLRKDMAGVLASEHGLGGAAIEECLSVAAQTLSMSNSILAFLKDLASRDHNVSPPAKVGSDLVRDRR